jgi:hypothetical protein
MRGLDQTSPGFEAASASLARDSTSPSDPETLPFLVGNAGSAGRWFTSVAMDGVQGSCNISLSSYALIYIIKRLSLLPCRGSELAPKIASDPKISRSGGAFKAYRDQYTK